MKKDEFIIQNKKIIANGQGREILLLQQVNISSYFSFHFEKKIKNLSNREKFSEECLR